MKLSFGIMAVVLNIFNMDEQPSKSLFNINMAHDIHTNQDYDVFDCVDPTFEQIYEDELMFIDELTHKELISEVCKC